MNTPTPPRDCKHGKLARKCDICELESDLAAAQEALRGMIDLAEFWINREDRSGMSEERYKIWLALGHQSNAMKRAKGVLK